MEYSVSCMCYCPENDLLCCGLESGEVFIVRAEGIACSISMDAVKEKTFLYKHMKGVCAVSWSSSSRYIVSCSDDCTAVMWDIVEKRRINTFKGHLEGIFCAVLNTHETLLVTGSIDSTIRVWDTRDGQCLKSLYAHFSLITSVSLSSDNLILASSGMDRRVCLWDMQSLVCRSTVIFSAPVSSADISQNGKYILYRLFNGEAGLLSVESRQVIRRIKQQNNLLYFVPFFFLYGHKNTLALLGNEEGSIDIWNIDTNTKRSLVKIGEKEVPICFTYNKNKEEVIFCILHSNIINKKEVLIKE